MRDAEHILGPGDLVLTVNRRLARMIRQQHDREQLDRAALVWPTVAVLPLSAWLEQCWEQLLDGQEGATADGRSRLPILLSAWQERLLWEQIIAGSEEGSHLLRQDEAAELARQAWQRIQEWQVTLSESDLYDHEDAEAFYAWSRKFASICNKQGWLDRARLPHLLRERLSQLVLPQRIFLAGFSEYGQPLPPLLQQFFLALQQKGVILDHWPSIRRAGTARRVGVSTVQEELLAAACWAREMISEQAGNRIGVVVPALHSQLPLVVDCFAGVFYPGINPAALDPRSMVFNLSLGAPLSSTPLIRDALLLLSLGGEHLALPQVTGLLHSPFWRGGQSEWAPRSLLDERLRRRGFLHIRLSRLRREAQRAERESPACPQLAATLNDFMQRLQEERAGGAGRSEKRKPSQWMECFGRWLQRLGWPGERPLSSGEYQNRMAWQEVLAQLATLDRTAGGMVLEEALQRVQQIAAATPFQPESEEAPVQIMGMLEAVGAEFTHLWITGLTAEGWPPPMEANPLLPIGWQRRHGLPFCDAKREWEAARQRMQSLLQAADQVICSYALQDEEQRMTPSPFWQQVGGAEDGAWLAAVTAQRALLDVDRLMYRAARWQWQQEEAPLSYGAEGGMVSSGVLKAQSLCPFQAYARYRLGARGRSEPGMGLDAAQRGQVVHAALHQLWVPESEHTLGETAAAEVPRETRIASAVAQALQQAAEEWPEPMHPFFQRLEAARLSRLLAAFLALEQERSAPFAVLGQEVERTLRLGPLTVRVRLDRVDRLGDGSLVVLDYKTGQSRVEHWLGERPLDPQLPLYVLAQMQNEAHPVVAVAFCQVRAGVCQFSGLASAEGLLPNVLHFQEKYAELSGWTALLEEWQRVLTALAEQFYRGEAAVDPLPGVCKLCDLTPLCRCLEQGVSEEEEREERHTEVVL